MKNFTNNFKQFTSRLSARWLIMALMMLVGTSSAWAWTIANTDKLYFDNSVTGWNTCYVQVGHSNYDKAFEMKRVPNTKNLWVNKTAFGTWTDAAAWYVTSEKWNTSGDYQNIQTKACYHNENTFIKPSTSDFGNGKVYKANVKGQTHSTSECNKKAWSLSSTSTTYSSSLSITVTNNTADAGTITITRWNSTESSAGSAYAAWNSTSAATASYTAGYKTALKVTATPKTGYKLKSLTVGGTSVSSGHEFEVTAATTIVATWEQDKTTYTVTYNANGGKDAPAAETKIEDEALTLTTSKPTRTGYTFQNWNTKADGTGTKYVSGAQYTANAAATLYAQWTANQYDITYKDQGGAAFSGNHETGYPTTHTYGTPTALKTASKTGYTFGGWFTTSACTGSAITQLTANGYASDITLYAKWECAKYVTAGTGSFSNGTITLSAKFNTCGNEYIGFQWKKQGEQWCYTNDGKETCYKALGQKNISNAVEETSFTKLNDNTLSGTYVFRPYIVVGNDAEDWLYGDEFTVTACITVATPDIDPVAICSGSAATLTLKNKQNGVTYTLDDAPIFTDGTTHTVNPDRTTTYTITATSDISCTAGDSKTANVEVVVNPTPSVSPSATVDMICEGETKTIKITTNAESIQWYKDGAAIDGAISDALDITKAGTYKVVVSNASGCKNEMSFEVANAFGSDITPTISGTTSVQSGATGVEYSTAEVSGAKYEWDLPAGWTISSGKETNKITVAVPDTEGNGTVKVTITKTNNGCAKTATLDVAWMDGFTVYLRRPHAKDETTQYNYWFEKSTAAGPGYIKFGTVKASPSNAEIYTYNGGSGAETPGVLGTKGTESFTDCDGYVWDAYNIGIDVTALYFHAPNNKSTNGSTYGGHATYTRSYSQDTPISSDLYFTMGNWSNGIKGRTLTKVDKPFEGIEIEALGDTEICSNNMASFAALYLSSNCTGKSVKSYAWKVSSDEESWDDYTTGKGATSNNIRPNVAGHYRLECELEDGNKVVSNSIEITTKTCTISNTDLNNITSNLPIIMVNTGDKAFPSVDNDKHCSASADDLKKKRSVDVKIIWNPNGTVTSTDAYSNGATLYYDRKARMNYRGSSSLNFEKKSFAFCPGDEMCGDDEKSADYVKTKKMNMFDLSGGVKDKDWVLYAAYVDPSMMRNILAMETYSAMTGKWGVDNQYVELYIDGEYQGVYIFMDKVTQNTGDSENKIPGRVNVKWDVKDDTKREFILKFDKTDAADRYAISSGDQKTFESDMTGKTGISTYDTEVDQRFEIEYPEKEDIEDDGGYWSDVYSFVLGKVNEFESALSKGDFTKVRDLINYESWADFFILNEFTKNVDAYRASCIFVYTGGKFEAWPLWDYELSFNNTVTGSGKGRGDINGLLIEHSDVYSDEFPAPFWWTGKYNGSNMYSGLLKDPCFLQKIKERWAEHTKEGGALHPNTTTEKTAAYKKILDANGAATREFTKWPVTSRGKDACNNANTGYYNYGGGGATNYDNSYKQLNEWLAGDADTDPRIIGLQKEINKFDELIKFGISSTIDKEATTPWRAVNVTVDAVGADFTYTITPEITKGQVIEGSGNLLIYAELPQTYTVVTTLDAKDQCGANPEENASSTVTFTVNDLVDNCEE